jgi:hypothetical protein
MSATVHGEHFMSYFQDVAESVNLIQLTGGR